MLAEEDLDESRVRHFGRGVGCGEDVLGRDESAAAEGALAVSPDDERDLPGILVLLGGLPAHDPSVDWSSLLPTLELVGGVVVAGVGWWLVVVAPPGQERGLPTLP